MPDGRVHRSPENGTAASSGRDEQAVIAYQSDEAPPDASCHSTIRPFT